MNRESLTLAVLFFFLWSANYLPVSTNRMWGTNPCSWCDFKVVHFLTIWCTVANPLQENWLQNSGKSRLNDILAGIMSKYSQTSLRWAFKQKKKKKKTWYTMVEHTTKRKQTMLWTLTNEKYETKEKYVTNELYVKWKIWRPRHYKGKRGKKTNGR